MSKSTPKTPTAPKNLAAAGSALWAAVTDEFDLAEHELALLRQACSTADAIDRLQISLDSDEVLDTSPQGRRVHPALPELRQQRIVFARLIAQLGVPVGDEDTETQQRRATRGTYRMRSAS
ncbi:MAG TPA: hypothetical protein VNQ73_14395 [Ilumatobacter sp.]|nr:hypothetical protein [Ilumatobacter sp.]